jgi:putative tryptophan/tyrosine transport system substrate-binding protein
VDRRRFVQSAGVAGLALLAGCGRLPGQAPLSASALRIGFLVGAISSTSPWVEAFRQGLRDLAYVEGQNLLIEFRSAEGLDERLPQLAAELVALDVTTIVTGGDEASWAAKSATSTIPIVMATSSDPVEAGLVPSLARPGGNVTGLSMLRPQLGAKRLEFLAETLLTPTRVAVLWHPHIGGAAAEFRGIEAAARVLNVELQAVQVHYPDEVEGAFEAIIRGRADALIVMTGTPTLVRRTEIGEFALRSRLPAIATLREFANAGVLMTYGPSLPAMYRRAAYYVDRIVKGTGPADLPIEQPTKFDFVLNLRTAQALDLTIPHHVLLQATEVLQ